MAKTWGLDAASRWGDGPTGRCGDSRFRAVGLQQTDPATTPQPRPDANLRAGRKHASQRLLEHHRAEREQTPRLAHTRRWVEDRQRVADGKSADVDDGVWRTGARSMRHGARGIGYLYGRWPYSTDLYGRRAHGDTAGMQHHAIGSRAEL